MEKYYLRYFEESSELSRLFYSPENIENLSNILRFQVYKHTQIKISPISKTKLMENMTNVYINYAQNSQDQAQIQRQQKKLNDRVVYELKTVLISNVRDYYDNLQDLDNPNGVYFAPSPINVSKRKSSGNRGQAEILFGTQDIPSEI